MKPRLSLHRFVMDPAHPSWCAKCGRRADVHVTDPTQCPHCGAKVRAAAGACFKCGELTP